MPFLALLLIPLVVLLILVLMPFTLVQRYRVGTRRQPVRGWLATLNVWASTLSTGLFVLSAAITAIWVPRALTYTLIGLGIGFVLGLPRSLAHAMGGRLAVAALHRQSLAGSRHHGRGGVAHRLQLLAGVAVVALGA